MALLYLVNECPVKIADGPAFINAWSFENISVGSAYKDGAGFIRINPRRLLLDPEAVAKRVSELAKELAKPWTAEDVRADVLRAGERLRANFEVQKGPFGIVVRPATEHRKRLDGHPGVRACFRITKERLHDAVAMGIWKKDEADDCVISEGMAAIADVFLVEFGS